MRWNSFLDADTCPREDLLEALDRYFLGDDNLDPSLLKYRLACSTGCRHGRHAQNISNAGSMTDQFAVGVATGCSLAI